MKTLITIAVAVLLVTGCATTKTLESRKTERSAAYAALSPEMKLPVGRGQIKVGMLEGAVYIAWGAPSQIARSENPNEGATI